jgi:putative aldouronate transport system permease protein
MNVSLRKNIARHKYFYLMLVPAAVCTFLFSYAPLAGVYLAFVDFKVQMGKFWSALFSSKFVGLQWFVYFLSGKDFLLVLRNTLASSVLTLFFGFFTPILLAVLLNECRNLMFKKFVQTISYLPYFVSWVIASNIIVSMLSSSGMINQVLIALGIIDKSIPFLLEGKNFWMIVALSNTWKDMGYNSIIYLASIASIDSGLFEAAQVDGAGRIRQIWHILLPSIRPTIVIMLILSIGSLLNTGFDQYFLLGNNMTREYSDVIETYAFRYGIQQGLYSYATAVGLFKSVIAFMLVLMANRIAKKVELSHLF